MFMLFRCHRLENYYLYLVNSFQKIRHNRNEKSRFLIVNIVARFYVINQQIVG
jgi:hypothetical protein